MSIVFTLLCVPPSNYCQQKDVVQSACYYEVDCQERCINNKTGNHKTDNQSCTNYDILLRTNRKLCLCTGMLYDPAEKLEPIIVEKVEDEKAKSSVSI